MGSRDNLIQFHARRRIAEYLKDFPVKQGLDHWSENDPAQMAEERSANLSFLVVGH
jgi:hypothetical protein